MASAKQAAPAVAPLADLFKYIGPVSADEAASGPAQAFLSTLRGYDPNASFVSSGQNSIEGGSGAGTVSLSFDPSKLPGMTGGQLSPGWTAGEAGPTSGASFAPNFRPVTNPSSVFSPSDIINSPAYGNVALDSSFKPQGYGLIDIIGPLAVAGLGMAGMAGLLPAFGGAGATGAGAAGAGAAAAAPFSYAGPAGAVDSWSAAAMGDPAAYGLGAGASGAAAGAAGTVDAWDPSVMGNPANYGMAAPITDASTQAPWWEATAARIGIPVGNTALSTLGNAAGLLRGAGQLANAGSALLGGAPLTGAGGSGAGGMAIIPGGSRQIADAGSLLRSFYAPRVRGSRDAETLDPSNPMSLLPLRMMGLIS